MKAYVGVDIGGTRIKLGVINEQGVVLCLDNVETPKELEDILFAVKQFVDRNAPLYEIEGVGISTPGIVKTNGYMQTSGAIKCFLAKNMKDVFHEYLNLPVFVENDSKCAAIAEKWIGAAKTVDNFVCLTLGTAVGGAIYINGKLVRGLGGLAGEFGVALTGREPGIYNEQSFSFHAAVVAGLCRTYSYAVKERVLDAKEIFRRAKEEQDHIAQECIDTFYHNVATLLINTAAIVAPELILLGGGISSNQTAMQGIQAAYDKMRAEYHVLSLVEMPRIKPCICHNEAGMIGAVKALLDH